MQKKEVHGTVEIKNYKVKTDCPYCDVVNNFTFDFNPGNFSGICHSCQKIYIVKTKSEILKMYFFAESSQP